MKSLMLAGVMSVALVSAGYADQFWVAGDRSTVTLPAGSTVSIRIQQPVSVTVEKE